MFYKESDTLRITTDPILRGLETEKYRSEFSRDYARILHSPSFRRLKGKTQLFPSNNYDFFRNRLTHSLEVAQIAKAIAVRLNWLLVNEQKIDDSIDLDLVSLAALAHDIGHPPFGHIGEKALDERMKNYGGFEGNAQTLRILSKLEHKTLDPEDFSLDTLRGLNLTYRSYASVLKYDRQIPHNLDKRKREIDNYVDGDIVKGYYTSESELVKKIKQSVIGEQHQNDMYTIECSIMDYADDIAYSVYDLEDALKGGLITLLDILSIDPELLSEITKKVNRKLHTNYDDVNITQVIYDIFSIVLTDSESSELATKIDAIDHMKFKQFYTAGFINNIAQKFSKNGYWRTQLTSALVGYFVRAISIKYNHDLPALSEVIMEDEKRVHIEVLKRITYEFQINSVKLKTNEHKGKKIIGDIFDRLQAYPGLLPNDFQNLYKSDDGINKERIICDFIASMTDDYAMNFYNQILTASSSDIFQPF